MPQDYIDLAGPDGGTVNTGGIKDFVYWAPKGDLDTIAAPPAAPASLSELVEIDGDHVFKSTKKMWKVYCTVDKGELNAALVGDIDGHGWNPELKIFYPGVEIDALGFIAQWGRDAGLLWVPLIGNGGSNIFMQIGMEDLWARVSAGSFGAAQNGEGVRGTELTIMSNQPAPLIYSGTLTLDPVV